MSAVDIVLILCFLPALVQGITKGFVAQVAAIVSIILGVWLTFRFSGLVSAWLSPYLQVSPQVLRVIAFILILVAVILVLNLIATLVRGLLKLVMLSWADKLLGMAFAFLKAALLTGLVIILFNTVNSRFALVDEGFLSDSVLYGPLKNFAYSVFPYFKDLLMMK